MAQYGIDITSSCREEADGSKTVTVEVGGLPDIDAANMVSRWMQKIIQENAHMIGRREVPARTQ